MKSTKRDLVALNLPNSVAALILFGRHVVLVMTGNTWFPSPTPALAGVTTNLDALEVAEAVAAGRTKGTAAARDVKRKAVEDDLTGLKGYVLGIARKNPAVATAIIESSGMFPKQLTKHQKAELAALMGSTPGDVILRAKASPKRRASYEWQFSSDGGKTWVAIGNTTTADHSVAGLTVGATYLFRVRITVGKTTADWSQTISFLVH
jgi:hypothetical protein